jgi:phosphate:Na+ symporter
MEEVKFAQIITAGIALTHTSFNVTNVLVFLPFAGVLGKIVTKLVPEKETKEVSHLTYLDVRMLDTPSLGIVQSQGQLNFMAESVDKMIVKLGTILESDEHNQELEQKIFRREEILDNVQKEVFLFLSSMVSGQVPHDITAKAQMQMRIADEYESLSDYVSNVLKGIKKLQQNDLAVEGDSLVKLLSLHKKVGAYITKINEYMRDESGDILPWANTEGVSISTQMKELRREHMACLQSEKVSPLFSLVYMDMLNFYRRMKDHALNIAEVLAGEK